MGNRGAAPVGEKRVGRTIGAVLGWVLGLMALLAASADAQLPTQNDPRVGLSTGQQDAGVASRGMGLAAHLNKPPGFVSEFPGNTGTQIAVANSDLAFQGDYAFVGNFNGFNIYNISNPAAPSLRTSVVCPGGQGDLSVYGNLMFT